MALYLGNTAIGNNNYLGSNLLGSNSIKIPQDAIYTIDYLIVAGGGGGGQTNSDNYNACGGGAGGYIEGSTILTPSTYAIVVGTGGIGATFGGGTPRAANGTNSTFNALEAIGGGLGGSGQTSTAEKGGNGGSGGGTAYLYSPAGSGTSGQGFNGNIGNGIFPFNYGGSGGGASSAAVDRTPGAGKQWLNGVTYAIGGGGAGSFGGVETTAGCGGNGRDGANGNNGQNGVVIIRYASNLPTLTGGTVTTSGGYKYHTFTTNGNLIVT
jgi:mucin-19